MPTEAPPNTLAVGTTRHQKYSSLGFSNQVMVYSPEKLYGMFVSRPGSGKSYLLQSAPGAFIFNFDRSSTVYRPPQAMMWPGINGAGQTIDVDQKPFPLDWARVRKKIDQLIELANKGLPRPEFVVFDSLTGMISLLRENAIKKRNKTDWTQIDGRAGWDEVYEICTLVPQELRSWGYGVYYTCHLGEKTIQLAGDQGSIIAPKLSITDNFFDRIHWQFELVVPITVEDSYQEVRVQTNIELPDGRKIAGPDKVTQEKKTRFFMDFENPALRGIIKARNLHGRLELPANEPWKAFTDYYTTNVTA